jgi:acyl carrier protein
MPSLETVIAHTLGMPEAAITDELSYQNGRWDSLNHIELMLALEQAFGVTIGAEDVERLG